MDFGMLFNDQHYSSAHIDGEILANDIDNARFFAHFRIPGLT